MRFDPSGSRRARDRRIDRQTLGRGASRARPSRTRASASSDVRRRRAAFSHRLDVFVLPSRSEGMSNALLEAMASGLPCIATDVGSNRSLLCPPAEPAAGRDLRTGCRVALPRDARDGVERGGPPRLRSAAPQRWSAGATRFRAWCSEYERLYRSVVGRPAAARGDRTGAMRHRMTSMGESDSPVRVVVVVSHLGLGGAERQTLELLRQLRGTAWAPVRVICLSAQVSPHGETVRALGYPLSIIARAGGFDVGRWLALRRLFRRERASVIHAVNWFASGYCGPRAIRRRAQIVSSIRNSHLPAGSCPSIGASAADPPRRQRARQLGARPSIGDWDVQGPARANCAGAERHRRRPAADRRPAGSAPPRAGDPCHCRRSSLYVGRNARVKNIPRLLDVVRQLLQTNPEAHIVLAGDGLDRRLVDGTDLASASRLHCLGPRDDIPSLLHDATLLLLTSDSEGMPNVVLEALAAGVPVVATAVGDLAQILPEQCGVLVPCDTEPLVAAVRRVITDAPSFARAVEQYSTRLRATHSVEAMASGTVAVWRSAVTSASAIAGGGLSNAEPISSVSGTTKV